MPHSVAGVVVGNMSKIDVCNISFQRQCDFLLCKHFVIISLFRNAELFPLHLESATASLVDTLVTGEECGQVVKKSNILGEKDS